VQAEAQLVRYEAEQLSKRRRSTQRDYRSILQRHVRPALGRHKISAVDFANIDRLHQTVTKASGPYRGNRVIAVVSKLFSLAMQWKRRADNPCRGIERNIESKRKRYLSGDELQRLSRALAEHDDRDAADIIRVLLLTGARRGEVLGMKWADVADGVWTKPAASTKQRAEHIVPLSAPARQILAARPRGDSRSSFPVATVAAIALKSNIIGNGSAEPPRSPTFAFTTFGIRSRALPWPVVPVCTKSAHCSDTRHRRRPPATLTLPTIICAKSRTASGR
jgi:integrase